MAVNGIEKRKKGLEERLKDHEETLQKHDERLAILESSSVLESKRLDSLCEQLMEFSFDIKEMLSSHDERMKEQEMECVKKEKDIESLAASVKGILSILRWTATTVFLLLAGFFIWYIQILPA
ncbi:MULTISPECIES: hypothetical protein [unclassified Dehalobacter]|uniref:hypothetical protein n=1 Tax=unclassified Dehalobacter TaxID=2635733 RepID=UPI00035D3557|nr:MULTISPECIES: hypothetical protein [unclassified Dehalobacter]RJE48701.1 hypothetical protein A7K50_10255 [Dehalobacter sp. MCB1]TCX53383.1 hypothetical protein C1I36_01105 [Dehalobacter sp. 14DCB1]TCX54398.1 hypothetical protein C1I38_06490 [Dehalobacter sp. 12DCB1]